ncbi:N-acetyltransferase [Spongiactinospora sp. TRM90649]|uniref:GNAT family N-acetyltransferase n=1 Tax=Spongiactinospora sp. TRM90649 TaxID=3031114 RepID=UPI0023F63FA7|nr:N-acetyltransferase [Spongiactinospora sp. TRM90649]MDF5757584.1 N-acetyltransferase [Spongiactinospora sp. TRM90649]
MSDAPFVPHGFAVPAPPASDRFRLEPLGPRHNRADHAAWTSSIDHIRATPGFGRGSWPPPSGMALDENLADLQRHADDFAGRKGFTYTVLDPEGTVVGCVYIYPSHDPGADAEVRSWVAATHADLDRPVYDTVSTWLTKDWPFNAVHYASRNGHP